MIVTSTAHDCAPLIQQDKETTDSGGNRACPGSSADFFSLATVRKKPRCARTNAPPAVIHTELKSKSTAFNSSNRKICSHSITIIQMSIHHSRMPNHAHGTPFSSCSTSCSSSNLPSSFSSQRVHHRYSAAIPQVRRHVVVAPVWSSC